MGAPDDVALHGARREQDRLGDPDAAEAPVRDDPEPAQAEQVGAAAGLRIDLLAEAPQRAAQQQAAGLAPRGGARRGSAAPYVASRRRCVL